MCSQPEEGALAGRIAIYNLCKLGLQKEVKGVRDPAGSRGVWWEETEADQQPGGGWGRPSGARPRSLASRSALPPKLSGRPLNRRRPGLIYRREVSIRKGRIFLSLSTLPQPGGYHRYKLELPAYPRGPLEASEKRCLLHVRSCAGPQTGGSGRTSTLDEVLQNPKLFK